MVSINYTTTPILSNNPGAYAATVFIGLLIHAVAVLPRYGAAWV